MFPKIEQSPVSSHPRLSVRGHTGWPSFYLGFASLTALVLLAIVWAEPRPVGDFYIALAAGRDIVSNGLASLAQPDTWSFMSEGHVWLNQNWGTGLIYYLAYHLGGDAGALILKGLLVIGVAVFVALLCRQRQVGWPVAVLACGAAVAAGRGYIDMRPNLMGLVMTPLMLWLLYRSRGKPHRIWAALAVMALWENLHGSFIFGIGILVLWATVWTVISWCLEGRRIAFGRNWPLLATCVAAIAFSALLTPYGTANLVHPFSVIRLPEWRSVVEWQPIYAWSWFGTTWEFYVVVGLLLALVVLNSAVGVARQDNTAMLGGEQLGLLAFSVCVCITLFVLATQWHIKPIVIYDSLRQSRWIVLLTTSVIGLAGALVIILWFFQRVRKGNNLAGPKTDELATIIFELCLAAVVITMAIKSRRMIPLAIIVLAPMVARQTQLVLKTHGKAWPVIPAALALLVPALFVSSTLYTYYNPNNPLLPPDSTFQRMMAYGGYPSGAAQFINANRLTGRVFHKWKWEGFLHWMCPQIKLFVGGRAQQVYPLQAFQRWRRIQSGTNFLNEELRDLGMHLEVVQSSFPGMPRNRRFGYDDTTRWPPVYFDGIYAVLADPDNSDTKDLITKAILGKLKYPDPGIGAMSKAACLQATGGDAHDILVALMEANKLRPTPEGFGVLLRMASHDFPYDDVLIRYLTKQDARLTLEPVDGAGGLAVLRCRYFVEQTLARLYQRTGDRAEASRWRTLSASTASEMAATRHPWDSHYVSTNYRESYYREKLR